MFLVILTIDACILDKKVYFVQFSRWFQNLLSLSFPASAGHKNEFSAQNRHKSKKRNGGFSHEPDPLYQSMPLSIRRRLHTGQRCCGRTAVPGRRLYPFHSNGRKAARIASPILRAGISSKSGYRRKLPARCAGIRHFRNPSR